MLFGRAQLVEQVEGLVDHPVRTRAGTVDLVHHHDRLEAKRQRFLGHEAGLRHRAFDRIHQQQHAVDHRQHALHLAAEVGVSRGVHDIDVVAFKLDRGVLGQNGDATLFFQIVAIHHSFNHVLVGGEGAGLLQELVHQGGLAVVDVGDNGDITEGA